MIRFGSKRMTIPHLLLTNFTLLLFIWLYFRYELHSQTVLLIIIKCRSQLCWKHFILKFKINKNACNKKSETQTYYWYGNKCHRNIVIILLKWQGERCCFRNNDCIYFPVNIRKYQMPLNLEISYWECSIPSYSM